MRISLGDSGTFAVKVPDKGSRFSRRVSLLRSEDKHFEALESVLHWSVTVLPGVVCAVESTGVVKSSE